jgi:hypothetical protein
MEIRIPRTATRRGAVGCYAKLLSRVDRGAKHPFEYYGRFIRPGGSIPAADLPEGNVVLLECTEIEAPPKRARDLRSWEQTYILWRLNRETNQWIEIARFQGSAGDWAALMRDTARMALGRVSWSIVPRVADAVERIRGLIDHELNELEDSQRSKALAYLHDEFATRISEAGVA